MINISTTDKNKIYSSELQKMTSPKGEVFLVSDNLDFRQNKLTAEISPLPRSGYKFFGILKHFFSTLFSKKGLSRR
ncbi:MAG: hypothetical protein IJC39_01735, partial [Firmicutes bacterium]|nr:hypothetical protein [Bacillota bacterium]